MLAFRYAKEAIKCLSEKVNVLYLKPMLRLIRSMVRINLLSVKL